MSDPIQDAIEQAQAAAGAVVENQAPATASQLPARAPQARAPSVSNSVADFGIGGLSVDGYIKPTEYGLLVPKEADKPIDEATVKIDLSECVRHLAIKASRGQVVKYWRTYDGVMTPEGQTWEEAQLEAQQLNEKAAPYESVDIPMTLLEDAGDAKAGDELGYSLSTTNKKAFSKFLRAVAKSGLDVNTAVVRVKLTSLAMKKNSYSWAIVEFELLGEYVEQ